MYKCKFKFEDYTIPKYSHLGDFHEGLAKVQNRKGYYGFIDRRGKEVIPCIYGMVSDFHEGLASAYLPSSDTGYIDHRGNVIIEPKFSTAEPFSEGYARVAMGTKINRYFYINKEEMFISEGFILANSMHCGYGFAKKTYEKKGYFDGEIFKEFATDPSIELGDFSEGFAVGYISAGPFIISDKLKIVYNCEDPNIVTIGNCSDGMFRMVDNRGKVGYMDNDFKVLVPPCFHHGQDFKEGYAQIAIDEDSLGYIDKQGKIKIFEKGTYSLMQPFKENRALVSNGQRFGFIDPDGKEVIPCKYRLANQFSEGLAAVSEDGDFYIDKEGFIVIPPLNLYCSTLTYNGNKIEIQANSPGELIEKKKETLTKIKAEITKELEAEMNSALNENVKSMSMQPVQQKKNSEKLN